MGHFFESLLNWRPTQERKLKSRSEEMEALRARAEQPAAAAELEKLRKSAFEQKLTHRRGLERAEARAEEAEARVAEARVAQEQRVSEGVTSTTARFKTYIRLFSKDLFQGNQLYTCTFCGL